MVLTYTHVEMNVVFCVSETLLDILQRVWREQS